MSKTGTLSESTAVYAARDVAEDISFAVELKFLVRHGRDDQYDPTIRPFVPNMPAELRDSMTRSEVQVRHNIWEEIAQALDALPNVDSLTGHQIQENGLEHTDYWKTHWIVYKSNSAVPPFVTYHNDDADLPVLDSTFPDYEKYVWIPVEVCSPVLRWSARARDHTGGEDALQVLRTVLETIDSGKCGAVFANYSTETHVHVGRVDGRFFSLATMKRLATLAWLSEPILRGVKDPNSPNFEHVYTWSSPLRRHSRLGMALKDQEVGLLVAGGGSGGHGAIDDELLLQTGDPGDFSDFIAGVNGALAARGCTTESPDHGNSVDHTAKFLDHFDRQALQTIWRTGSHQELGKMLIGRERQYRRLGFNFLSLGQDQGETSAASGPRTVEFRFLEGFVDTRVVPAWVRLCGAMVELAAEGEVESGKFHDVVATLLLVLSDQSPLDVKFRAFVDHIGEGRIPGSVWDPLQEVIRRNYPPDKAKMNSTLT